MTLNITERDKKLLIILAFAVVGFLLYLLVYTPQMQTLSNLNAQLMQVRENYNKTIVSDQYIAQTQSQIDKAEEAIKQKADGFMPTYSADKFLYLFSTLAQNSGLQVSAITTPGPQVVDLNKIASSPASSSAGVSYTLRGIVDKLQNLTGKGSSSSSSSSSASSASTPSKTPANMEKTTLSLTLTGSSYANVLAFMKSIEAQKRSIRFTSVEISKSGNSVTASLQIDIYSIDKIPGQDTDYQFNASSPNGTPDPFR